MLYTLLPTIQFKQAESILVIIDKLVAYLSAYMDINKANQVRYATARLVKLAETYNLAMLAVRHLTKGSVLKSLYRVWVALT